MQERAPNEIFSIMTDANETMNELHQLFFIEQGIALNKNDGYYQRGRSYGIEKKLLVAATYLDAKEICGTRPNITHIARQCSVGWEFVTKVEKELLSNGHVDAPEDIYKDRSGPSGPGSISLCAEDSFVLYQLYRGKPTRSLKSYVSWLFYHTGTIVSESTVSRFFLYGFPIRGSLCQPNLVPYDKFRPGNIAKAAEYLKVLAKIDPRRIKYGDEKSLKGKAIHNKKARRDIVSGIIPATMTDPDLRNTYSIIGICGIDRKVSPVRYRITELTVDAELFGIEIEAAIASRFLRAGDTLVLDNAANHSGKENTVLEDWCWNEHRIFILFLPARAPEWNPIELLWNILTQRLKSYDWESVIGSHRVVTAAAKVLNKITHGEVEDIYASSGVFDHHRS